jgi:phage repressor protein C with HTH and peptisase S24 domain
MSPIEQISSSKKLDTNTKERGQADFELGGRIEQAMRDAGMSAERLAKELGVTESGVRGNLRGKVPSAKLLFKMARILDVHPEWLALGFGEPSNYSRGLRWVPKYSPTLSAGPGSWVARSEQIDLVVFNGNFLSAFGSEASTDFIVLDVTGDSMEPTIRDNAQVLIDVNSTDWADGIWAFALGDNMRIKRLRRGLKSLQVISDNPAYPPEEITAAEEDQLHLIGRVRWVGQTL